MKLVDCSPNLASAVTMADQASQVASKEDIGCVFIAADSVMTDGVSGGARRHVGPVGSSSCVRISRGPPDLAQRPNLIAQVPPQAMFVLRQSGVA